MKDYVIGVDLGGTKVEACLLDTERNCLARCRVFSEASQGLDRVIENIVGVIDEAAGGKAFQAVGMGTPGTYILKDDALYGSPHTPVYETPGFIGRLREKLKVPLLIENDANCLGLAEYYASCFGRYSYVMAVILGTGMGYGLILDGKLYRGARGGAGEIGHTILDYRGRMCTCGRQGCAEAYLSGPALRARFYEATGSFADPAEIYELYKLGNAEAVKLIDESCRLMGEVFANVVNSLDLEAIILGGGVSNLPVWYDKVPQYLMKSLFGVPRGEIPIIQAKLGDSAGVFGAAYLALREIGMMDF